MTCFRHWLAIGLAVFSSIGLAQTNETGNAVFTLRQHKALPWAPTYILSVYKDGRVQYAGGGSARTKGAATSRINPKDVETILAAFDHVGFSRLESTVHPALADKPSVSLTLHSIERTLSLGAFGPRELVPLIQLIERTVELKKWVCPLDHAYENAPKCHLD